jgi:hypothetical protein
MSRQPDAIVESYVYLTSQELGAAFARRSDDEQADILRAIVKGFDNYPQAELQASYLGSRLFSQSADKNTQDVLNFLRQILYCCREDADKVRQLATVPEAQP